MKARLIAFTGAGTLALVGYQCCWQPTALTAMATVTPPSDTQPKSMLSEITAYEKKFFERSFEGESSSHRLDRLDTFIFGATNKGSAQARIARIDQVVPLASVKPESPAQSPGSTSRLTTQSSAPAVEPALESPGNYPHITALEAKLLGETYPQDHINQRLSRLETKVFGAPSKSKDLEERTDDLDRHLLARRTPKAMTIGMPLDDDEDGVNTPPPDLLGRYEKALGAGSLTDRYRDNALGAGSQAPQHLYENADEDPGAIVKHQEIEEELADARKSTPPTKEERTLSRIAWCEQQIFGHAYPEMHLLKRLHQLNHELFPDDKEPDIQLMDHIDTIVKEVVLRKQPHQPGNT